jgi:putative hydrolase of the HAD superfamily
VCDIVIYSHEEGMRKPDPRFYALACERLEVVPEAVLFVDDTLDWVEAARQLGMVGVHFHDNAQAIAEIRSHLSDRCP